MLRMIIPLVIIFLLYLLAQTFMMRSGEKPIDVDPIDPETDREKKHAEDDVIDVDAIDPDADPNRG
ncbi:MAG: hypothetical protein Q4C36_01385 [Coriobacteriia bacterium]|nr:hypothetical protein [Coriobacteriia bacterium]